MIFCSNEARLLTNTHICTVLAADGHELVLCRSEELLFDT